MIILSGIPIGSSGVGRLVAELDRQRSAANAKGVRIVSRRLPGSYRKLLREGKIRDAIKWLTDSRRLQEQWARSLENEQLLNEETVILIHPQTLGYRWCGEFIERRRHPTWLYLVDASHFCARSYNYVEGTNGACLRCVGGQWQHADELGCYARMPDRQEYKRFSADLRAHAATGKAKFLVQNARQLGLAQDHFGTDATIVTVGLWTVDMPDESSAAPAPESESLAYDVVFHGAPVPAKGFTWALELAKRCPQRVFLFPCSRRRAASVMPDIPKNARFEKMNWESGLADAVQAAKVVLVPSLWSAPIEGALIKSVVFGKAVAVVDQATTFSSELPDNLVVRLPVDLDGAAYWLTTMLESDWRPAESLRRRWLRSFRTENRNLLNQLRTKCEPGGNALAACG